MELQLVPWLCSLLTRETFSPECQKAAVQALQLLGLCGGQSHEQMATLLGPRALAVVLDSQDAVRAALALTPDLLSTLHPQIDAFLAVHRRNLRPEPLHMPDSMAQLLETGKAPAETLAPAATPAPAEAPASVATEEVAATGGDATQPKLA